MTHKLSSVVIRVNRLIIGTTVRVSAGGVSPTMNLMLSAQIWMLYRTDVVGARRALATSHHWTNLEINLLAHGRASLI